MHPDLFESYAGTGDNVGRVMAPMQQWAKWTARVRAIAILLTYPELGVRSDVRPHDPEGQQAAKEELARYCGISLYDCHGAEVFHDVAVVESNYGESTTLSGGVVVDGTFWSLPHVELPSGTTDWCY